MCIRDSFHGRPEAGVKDMAMSLVLLRDPVFLGEKRIKAAITFAAVDKNSHLQLMRELGGYLQDEEFLSLLRNNGSCLLYTSCGQLIG